MSEFPIEDAALQVKRAIWIALSQHCEVKLVCRNWKTFEWYKYLLFEESRILAKPDRTFIKNTVLIELKEAEE